MPDYVAVSDATISKGKPWGYKLARIFRDNVLAIIAGGVGAPRISPKAIGGFMPGDVLVFSNDTAKAMTAQDPTVVMVKSIKVMHDGTYRLKYSHGINSGFGAIHQVYVDGVAQGPVRNSPGDFTIDVSVLAGQNVEVRGNGGGNPGASGATIFNMRLYVAEPVDFGVVA